MYELVKDAALYMNNIPGFITLIAGHLAAMLIFVLVVFPLHNYIKYMVIEKCGDKKRHPEDYLTMKPSASFHWMGAISVFVLQMGFSFPIYQRRDRYYNPVLYTIYVALSGIGVYLGSFFASLLLLSFVDAFDPQGIFNLEVLPVNAPVGHYIYYGITLMLYVVMKISIYSAVINLIPLVPLDMGDVLYQFLPLQWSDFFRNNQMAVSAVVVAVLFLSIGQPGGFVRDISTVISEPVINGFYFVAEKIASLFI